MLRQRFNIYRFNLSFEMVWPEAILRRNDGGRNLVSISRSRWYGLRPVRSTLIFTHFAN